MKRDRLRWRYWLDYFMVKYYLQHFMNDLYNYVFPRIFVCLQSSFQGRLHVYCVTESRSYGGIDVLNLKCYIETIKYISINIY